MPSPDLKTCWPLQDCKSCLRASCGWCPTSSTCVPAISLLSPLTHPRICPLSAERYELRTKALGCGCSTTTLLSVLVTVLVTLLAVALVWGLMVVLRGVNPFLGSGLWRGTEIEVKGDVIGGAGKREEKVWVRDSWGRWVYRVWKRPDLNARSEQEERTERSRLLG